MNNIHGIPVYDLTIDMLNDEYGVSVISLVENPAVEKAFITLSDQSPIRLSVVDDRKIITGVALRADYPIYRKDPATGKEYFFRISAEQIERIMQKFMAEKRLDMVNIEHDPRMTPKDIFLWESYQLTDKHKIGYPEFADIETGSWMVSYKVDNNTVWKAIKSGRLRGFSAEIFGNLNENKEKQANLSAEDRAIALYLLTII